MRMCNCCGRPLHTGVDHSPPRCRLDAVIKELVEYNADKASIRERTGLSRDALDRKISQLGLGNVNRSWKGLVDA